MSAPDVLIVGESGRIELKLTSPLNQSASITFLNDQENLLEWSPKSILIPQNSPASNFTIKIEALKAGRAEVTGISNPKHLISDSNLSFKITIGNSRELISTSFVVGWAYFLAWSICSYPQIWLNYKRKSVVGLSFDFLALNIIGHVSYTIFNLCFYFSEFFQDEYFTRFPNGQTPVLLNDVFSTSHSLLVCLVMIFQCFVYQNGKQSISYITWTLLGAFMTIVGVNVFFCSVGALHWLDILYTLSYIKLAVTLTKYIPQAVLNCRRKSTVGWSIERVLLDLIGGVLSILQMLINAYNYAADEQCSYGYESGLGITVGYNKLYTCDVINTTEIIHMNWHRPGRTDYDVKYVQIQFDGFYEEFDQFYCFSFENLEQFGISGTKIQKFGPNFFKDCNNLKHISISSNGVKELPADLLLGTSILDQLDITNNDFEILPEAIFLNLNQLTHLHLDFNKIKDLPPKIFSSLSNLKLLSIRGNQITKLNPKWFENLQNLEFLQMNNNKVKELPDNTFVYLTGLTHLEFANNGLQTLNPNSFANLKSLKTLYLSENDITGFPKNVFKPLENLTFLWINDNKIKTIHSDSFGMHNNLVMSGMSNNKIEAIDEKFIDNVALTHMFLEGNICIKEGIKGSDRSVMKQKLKQCFENYQPRQDVGVDEECSFGYSSGSGLTLGYNDLYTCTVLNSTEPIQVNQHCPGKNDNDVKYVQNKYDGFYEDYNQFHCISFPNLEQFGIIKTQIRKFGPNFFKNCNNLRFIPISSNGLKELPEDFFAGTKNLGDLHISDNNFDTLPENIFSNLNELKFLSLEFNGIKNFPPKVFSSLTTMSFLVLSGNKITNGLKIFKIWNTHKLVTTILRNLQTTSLAHCTS
ncbi:unnamed protein product [Chironomus riparius]|uniref:Uncharacterized protein n=1 Tax=Chironomus riparius TaxID=315576 RepID=A0A9N9X135_9DIPT|nr:unnamed protein product [Chironomus riparius]